MTQKVIKVGSSAAVVIPKKSLKGLGISIGDDVAVEVNTTERILSIRASGTADRELLEWSRKFIKRYRPALEALARK